MAEKVIDIFPPEVEKEEKQLIKEEERKILLEKTAKHKFPKKRFFFFFLLLILIGGFLFAYFNLSRAQIDVWPKTEVLNFNDLIEINATQSQPDFSLKIFPGIVFEEEIEVSQDFPASGRAQKTERAKGIIRVFNAYSQSPQTLIANTRFVSADGKLFKSIKNVVIPGGSLDGKERLEPGFLDVEVIAAEPGDEYNIGPSTFSIPGFLGTERYTAFYGKSSENMKGGFRGEAPQVMQSDLEEARSIVLERLTEEGIKSLKNKIPSGFLILDDAISQTIIDESSSEFAGKEEENFKLRIKANLKILTFRKVDIEDFVKDNLLFEVAPSLTQENVFGEERFWIERKIQEQSLVINYGLDSVDWENNKMALTIDFSAKIYPEINNDFVKMSLVGKSEEEIGIFISSQQFVERLNVDFWPFWVKIVPKNKDKIFINLNI